MKMVKDKQLLVGADFAGYPLKEAVCAHLRQKGWEITDVGVTDPNTEDTELMFHRIGLRVGSMMDAGFSQILVMYNPTVYKSGDIIGTYVYRIGLGQLNFSQGTLVGLFNSVVNCILMLGGNMLSRKLTEKSIW